MDAIMDVARVTGHVIEGTAGLWVQIITVAAQVPVGMGCFSFFPYQEPGWRGG